MSKWKMHHKGIKVKILDGHQQILNLIPNYLEGTEEILHNFYTFLPFVSSHIIW